MNFDISEWEEVSSTSLSDAMLGLHTMESSIKPLNRKMRVVGPAYTVQIIKNDCAVIFKALQEAPEGSVLVIAAQGTTDVAFLGEIVTKIAQKQGIAGIVIDGCVRDSLAISEGGVSCICQRSDSQNTRRQLSGTGPEDHRMCRCNRAPRGYHLCRRRWCGRCSFGRNKPNSAESDGKRNQRSLENRNDDSRFRSTTILS